MSDTGLRLQKLGGRMQLLIEVPDDLEQLLTLDEAHWAATSIPCDIYACDPVLFEHLDTDRNGRIRTDELREAVRWTFHRLKDRSHIGMRSEAVRLSAIETSHDEGKVLKRTAQRVLQNLGVEAPEVTLEQIRDRKRILASGVANGDGVIPPGEIEDDDLSAFMSEIMQTVGAVKDLSGQQGVTATELDAFLADAKAYLEWEEKGRLANGSNTSDVLPLGNDTASAYTAFERVEAKLDQYFALCALANIDGRVAEMPGLSEEEIAGFDTADAPALRERLKAAPLAEPNSEEVLSLDESINPAWREAIGTFAETVIPAFVKEHQIGTLRAHQWEKIKASFNTHKTWRETKAGESVESLGAARLKVILESDLVERLRALMAEDASVAEEIAEIRNLEKLALYQRWLMEFANNFVAWPALYNPKVRSLVEQGTLVMDGRRFGLCVRVTDRKRHKVISEQSQLCLLYCQVRCGRGSTEKEPADGFEIAVAVTVGTMRNLFKGKQGLFLTRDGLEMDAEIVEVLENPVSLWEALKQPFRRIGEFVGKQAERFTSSRYSDVEKGLGQTVTQVDKSVQTGFQGNESSGQAGKQEQSSTAVRDILLGGGVAVAALGGTLAMVSQTVHDIGFPGILKALVGVSAILAVPTVLVAWVKMRQRNLAMLLEACGVAMNQDMLLKPSTGYLFTRIPPLPQADEIRRVDMTRTYLQNIPEAARRHTGLLLAILIGLILGSVAGYGWHFRKLRNARAARQKASMAEPATRKTGQEKVEPQKPEVSKPSKGAMPEPDVPVGPPVPSEEPGDMEDVPVPDTPVGPPAPAGE